MTDSIDQQQVAERLEVLRNLLDVGAKLQMCRDRQQTLETILAQARSLTRAEAGSLYLLRDDRLRFVAAQNDLVGAGEIARHLLGREIPVSFESLVGFVASTGEIVDIPDSRSLPPGSPFRINRDMDAATGYSVQTILAIPLKCPDGECVGVLELFNRLDGQGSVLPFSVPIGEALVALVSTAAVTVHNVALREQLRRAHLNTIFRLSTVAEYRDADTSEHIHRVSRCSELIARKLGLSDDEVELVKYASPMHDVGKVAIPDAILLKPGHLTARQRRVMERHTIVGGEIFAGVEDVVLKCAREIALTHHERWDGCGYPARLKGRGIPQTGRIVGLADVFDAVVSRRCYKDACSLDVALDILDKDTGKHFDPEVVEAFLAVLDDVLDVYPALKAG